MKKISHFCAVKKGNCYLFKPKPPKDKRKTIIIVGDKTSDVFAFNEYGLMKKIIWKNEGLNDLVGFYYNWFLYKLNKKEKLEVIKELIIETIK